MKIEKSTSIKDLTESKFFARERNNHTDCLRRVCAYLKENGISPKRVLDAMAGEGFGTKAMMSEFGQSRFTANDLDEECRKTLSKKLKGSEITGFNFLEMGDLREFDLVFVDFNTFTLAKIKDWGESLLSIKSEWLLLTDTACFGVLRFRKNRHSYSVNNLREYYLKLSYSLNRNLGAVDHHNNAAVVALTTKGWDSPGFLYEKRVREGLGII